MTEANKKLYKLWKNAHDIIVVVWKYIKRKRVVADQLDDKEPQANAKDGSKTQQHAKSSEETELHRQERELTKQFDGRVRYLIADYLRMHSTYMGSARRVREKQAAVKSHVGTIVEKSPDGTVLVSHW